MTAFHAHFHLRNQQAFQRLLEQSKDALATSNGGGGPSAGLSLGGTTSSSPPHGLLSTSAGRSSSWSKNSPIAERVELKDDYLDVNAKDMLGRTVLHLACTASVDEPAALEYVKLLLAHPRINPNLADNESRWTPLHRALYSGNIPASVLLLQRSDIDITLKDYEGYTAFDLYNSTVEGTKPDDDDELDLYTWGSNRNALLGVGDGDDRAHPEHVPILPASSTTDSPSLPIRNRFLPLRVTAAKTAKLHTAAVIEDDFSADIISTSNLNVRVCGFGNGGRSGLGGGAGSGNASAQHMQYALTPVKDTSLSAPNIGPSPLGGYPELRIIDVALGQDHTLALTSDGHILSWGLNRFSQLGYATEGPAHLQLAPRRVVGPLKKEHVVGVAACRTASTCWTRSGELYSWGTSNGQLGWEEKSSVAGSPRRVTSVSGKVICARVSENAMVVLLESSRDVYCFFRSRSFKIAFPTQSFPSEIQTYRPPKAQNKAAIAKIAHCPGEDTFAAVSNGEVFTFAISGDEQPSVGNPIRPQRVWALRKQFSAVKDVALGAEGTIILCTDSGHVYLRSRSNPGPKSGNVGSSRSGFTKVKFLQRVVNVDASPSGAYMALRARVKPEKIAIDGRTLEADMGSIIPFGCDSWQDETPEWLVKDRKPDEELCAGTRDGIHREPPPNSSGSAHSGYVPASGGTSKSIDDDDLDDEQSEELAIKTDVDTILILLDLIERGTGHRKRLADEQEATAMRNGADVLICLDSGFEFPSHKLILASRSSALNDALSGRSVKESDGRICISSRLRSPSSDPADLPRKKLNITGTHPLSALLVVTYLYTDNMPCVWDRRIAGQITNRLSKLAPRTSLENVGEELRRLSKLLKLRGLEDALSAPVKRPVEHSLNKDLCAVYEYAQSIPLAPNNPCRPDVILELTDGNVYAHSSILRARSPFFAAFFGNKVWSQIRVTPSNHSTVRSGDFESREKDGEGTVRINMKHRQLREMSYAMRFIYGGSGEEMFNILTFAQSPDDVLELLYSVLDIAEELLIERLTQVCAAKILDFLTPANACALLVSAAPYPTRATRQLIHSLHSFLARSMETLLESRMLDDLPHSLVRGLARYIRERQREKMPVTRNDAILKAATEKWKEWLEQEDWPAVIVRSRKVSQRQIRSPRLSPKNGNGKDRQSVAPTNLSLISSREKVQAPSTPPIAPIRGEGEDEIFEMDGIPALSSSSTVTGLGLQTSPPQLPRPSLTTKRSEGISVGSPWKSQAVAGSSKSSLRSIMEAENRGQASPRRLGTPSRTPDRPRLPLPRESILKTPTASGSLPTSTNPIPGEASRESPLRSVKFDVPASNASTPSTLIRTGAQASPGFSGLQAQRPALTNQASQTALGKGKSPMGPTFVPTRQATPSQAPLHTASVGRRVSDGTMKAWTNAAVPFPQSSPSQPCTLSNAPAGVPGQSSSPPQHQTPVSFLSIQQEQHEVASSLKAPPKSLIEIQAEEEARVEEERELSRLADRKVQAEKEEADFLRWWKREESRIRRETKPVMGPPVGRPGGGQGPADAKGKRRGGRRGAGGTKKAVPDNSEKANPTPAPAAQTASVVGAVTNSETQPRQHRPRRPRGGNKQKMENP